jgi:hypothetical protein
VLFHDLGIFDLYCAFQHESIHGTEWTEIKDCIGDFIEHSGIHRIGSIKNHIGFIQDYHGVTPWVGIVLADPGSCARGAIDNDIYSVLLSTKKSPPERTFWKFCFLGFHPQQAQAASA